MKSAIRKPEARDLAICPLLVDKTATGLVLALDNLGRPCCDIGFGPHMQLCIARKFVSGSPSSQPPSAKLRSVRERRRGFAMAVAEASPGKLFREARRARPQRQNNGARACDGAGLPWLSASKIPPLCIARKLPAQKKRRKRARGRLSQKLWPSPGKLFREARASPQRQNNGARACDGAGLPWLSRKLRPSPGKLFREARRASSQRQNYGSERERRAPSEAVAEASAVAQKVFLGSPTGLTPASKR